MTVSRVRPWELLASAAILVSLGSVLFPVVAKARSKSASNMANSHSIGIATSIYSSDYDALTTTGCLKDDANWASQNGGCQDLTTGLVWSRTSNETTGYYNRVYKRPPGDTRLPGAWDYCNALAEGSCPDQPDGFCHGWRLPTKDESVLAASHQIKNYAPMANPDTWHRPADPSYLQTTGKYKGDYFCYWVELGNGSNGTSLWKDTSGYLYSVGDAICVRSP